MLAVSILSPVMAPNRLAVSTVSQLNLWDTYLLCLLLAVSTGSVQVLGSSKSIFNASSTLFLLRKCYLHKNMGWENLASQSALATHTRSSLLANCLLDTVIPAWKAISSCSCFLLEVTRAPVCLICHFLLCFSFKKWKKKNKKEKEKSH